MIIINNFAEIDEQQWSAFITNHPKGSVFQSPQMYRCYEQMTCHQPVVFAAYQNAEIIGILLAVTIHEKGIKKLITHRCIVQSGPIVKDDDPKILDALLEELDYIIGRQVVYIRIRNQFDQLGNCDVFIDHKYKFISHLNILIHLDGEDNIWNRLSKKRRKHIKKAQEKGLYINIYAAGQIPEEMLKNGYEIIKELGERASIPIIDYELLAATNTQGILNMFIVQTQEGDIAGCRFALTSGKTLYGWWAGCRSRYYNLYPNDLMIWETLRWAYKKGFNMFDYGGAGSPNEHYGVRDFKKQIGGDLVNFGRYGKTHSPWKMRLATIGIAINRKLKLFRF